MSVIPAGYKQTEAGVIPEDWGAEKLGKYASFRTGPFGSALHQSDYVDDGVPVINPMQIIGGKIQPTQSMAITEQAARKLANFRLSAGSIVIGRRGEMGRCALISNSQEGWLCGTGSMIIRVSRELDAGFLQRVLSSPPVISVIENTSVGSTMINLNQGTLGNLVVPVPPRKAEQEAIAEALSDADALIESLEQLLAKKRHLKQAAMQELLTGKKRLPGFGKDQRYKQIESESVPDDWEVTTLSQVSKLPMQNGLFFQPSRKGSGVRLINVGDLFSNAPINTSLLDLFDATAAEQERFKVDSGDLFFTRSSIVPSGIAHCNFYLSNSSESVVFDSHVIRFRPDTKKVAPTFLYRWCIASVARHYLVSKAKTGTMTTIDQSVLGKCPVFLPTISEQAAIATVLSDMDAELAELESEFTKSRSIKQGMMQKLLTGEIRLI